MVSGAILSSPCMCTPHGLMLHPHVVYIMKYKYTPAVRSNILPKLIFASCLCDTPIARITGCVSSFRIYLYIYIYISYRGMAHTYLTKQTFSVQWNLKVTPQTEVFRRKQYRVDYTLILLLGSPVSHTKLRYTLIIPHVWSRPTNWGLLTVTVRTPLGYSGKSGRQTILLVESVEQRDVVHYTRAQIDAIFVIFVSANTGGKVVISSQRTVARVPPTPRRDQSSSVS